MTTTTILVIIVFLLTLALIRQKGKHEAELNRLALKKLDEKTTQAQHDSNQIVNRYNEVSNLKWENFQLKLENMLLQGKISATELVNNGHVKMLTNTYAVQSDIQNCAEKKSAAPTEQVFDISDEVTHVH